MAEPIMNTKLDLSDAESARKALHDIHSAQKDLKRQNRNLKEGMERKAADLRKISKRLSELEERKTSAASGSNADLKKYVREDGSVRSTGEATSTKSYMPGLLDDAPVCDWQHELQKAVEQYTMVKTLSPKGAPKSLAKVQEIASKAPVEVQRIFTDASTVGTEFIPQPLLPEFERNLQSARRLAAAFDTMDLPSKTTLLPFLSTGFRPYIKAQAAADDPAQYTSSSMVTAQRTITATGFAVRAQVADDAEEDSLVAVLPTIRAELLSALVDGEEDAILNGSTGTHPDSALASWNIRGRWGASGLGGSADHRRAWDGLRKHAINASFANNATNRATFSASTLLADLAKLDAPHGTTGSAIIITSPEAYLLELANMEQVLTMEKFPQPTIVDRNQLAQVFGCPIILSDFIDNDLQSTGLYTSSGGGKTMMLIVNRDRYRIGARRGATVEVDKDITRGVHSLVSTVRETFFSIDDDTKKNITAMINIDATT
ncbi:MAG: putative capsid family protein [Prokaryotic dsDNA virus sp.]|jgi:hypothetical protein|nr:MAG: putative capsid family protein [Prokaryotic dsDNA virus sp.]|tara:strand:+ start:2808 stop:4274 length:1467 start_codon:yes stop_codon:yes gene_type:complete